jgi:hypothetical protein
MEGTEISGRSYNPLTLDKGALNIHRKMDSFFFDGTGA